MVDICEVRYEYPDYSSKVAMVDSLNKKMDQTHRDISENDIETYRDAMKMVIEEFPDGHDDDKIYKHQIKN